MKRHVAFLLSLLIGAGSAFAQSGETINQLSPGTALQGTEQIPMYQGSNPAVTTTARALATYIPTQFNTIDATQVSGADICAKISAAAIAAAAKWPGGATIDARGFTGSNTCAGNMFANWPSSFKSRVLLGDVQITVSVSQVVPTYTTLEGTLPQNDTDVGAAFVASGSFPTNTPLLDLGPSNPAFSIHVNHIGLNCSGISGSIGLRNIYSQEQTVVDHIVIRGCYTGLLADLTFGDTNLYTFLTMTDASNMTGSSYRCIQVGQPSDTGSSNNHFTGEIAYVSCGAYTVTPMNYVLLDGFNFAVRHIYQEGNLASVAGINIGSQNAGGLQTSSVTIDNVAMTSAATAVRIGAGVAGPVNLFNISGGSTTLLNDTLSGGCVIPIAQETQLGFYARGYTGRIISNSSYCPKP